MRTMLCCLFLLITSAVLCQTATFRGLVFGIDRKPLGEAQLRIVDGSGAVLQEVVSSQSGAYAFVEVAAGTYTLHYSKEGYQAGEVAGIRLDDHKITFMDVDLKREETTTKGKKKGKKPAKRRRNH